MSLTPHLEPREWPLGLFSPNPENPRFIRDDRFESLKRSLSEFPWMMQTRPIIARPDGRVLAGNMRLRAAAALGWTKIFAVVVGDEIPNDDVEKLVALVDNNAYGEWDEQLVAEWLYDLRERDVDLDLSGFAEGDVRRILASVSGDEEPRPPSDGHVDYRCPECGHGWSGHPRPKNRAGDPPDDGDGARG